MLIPNRHNSSNSYRYGFQGQEKDDELKGPGNSLNYEFRMHDPRVGRFFAVDPLTKKYPFYSPYQFSGNRVIDMVELEGLEPGIPAEPGEGTKTGNWQEKGANGLPNGVDSPTEELNDVVVHQQKSTAQKIGEAIVNAPVNFFGAMTGASSINKDPKLPYNPAYYPSTDQTDAALICALPVLPIVAEAAPIIAGGYEAYCGWYAGTATSNYFAGATATGIMIDVFGTNSFRVGAINGLTNATGQIYSNDGFSNFNYAQPVSAALFKNPFTSNFGESFFKVKFENGQISQGINYFNKSFFSTFSSNYLGGKISAKLEINVGYKPVENFTNFFTGSGTEVIENYMGNGIDKTIDIIKK